MTGGYQPEQEQSTYPWGTLIMTTQFTLTVTKESPGQDHLQGLAGLV